MNTEVIRGRVQTGKQYGDRAQSTPWLGLGSWEKEKESVKEKDESEIRKK